MARTYKCAHCGRTCGDYAGGDSTIIDAGRTVHLCHPNDPRRPDCYHLVTVYHEALGSRRETIGELHDRIPADVWVDLPEYGVRVKRWGTPAV